MRATSRSPLSASTQDRTDNEEKRKETACHECSCSLHPIAVRPLALGPVGFAGCEHSWRADRCGRVVGALHRRMPSARHRSPSCSIWNRRLRHPSPRWRISLRVRQCRKPNHRHLNRKSRKKRRRKRSRRRRCRKLLKSSRLRKSLSRNRSRSPRSQSRSLSFKRSRRSRPIRLHHGPPLRRRRHRPRAQITAVFLLRTSSATNNIPPVPNLQGSRVWRRSRFQSRGADRHRRSACPLVGFLYTGRSGTGRHPQRSASADPPSDMPSSALSFSVPFRFSIR